MAFFYFVLIMRLENTKPPKEAIIDELQERIDQLEQVAFSDYNKALTQSGVVIVQDQSTYSPQGKITGEARGTIKIKGKIADGYVLIEASVDESKKLTKYDSVYLKLNNVGGHLLRNKSLPTPSTDSGTTTILYSLRAIPYLPNMPYDENKSGSNANWLDSLNSHSNNSYLTFISSLRPGGKIHRIMLTYECAEPEKNCQVSSQ